MMRFSQRGQGAVWFIVLLLSPMALFAQPDSITIVGSGVVTPLFETIADAADVELDYATDITGTSSGFDIFCTGGAAVVNTTRAISIEEERICQENDIEFGEIVLGYNAVAFITNPQLDFLSCATTNELSSALAPSSIQYSQWNEALGSAELETEIELFLPNQDTLSYFLADELVGGVGFRSDSTNVDDASEIIDVVRNSDGGIGVVNLNDIDSVEGVQVIEIRNNEIARCVEPTAENVGDGSYIAGTPLLSYINATTLEASPDLKTVFEFVSSEEYVEVILAEGFAPPTDFDYTTNADIVRTGETGRQFSRALTAFQIPPTVAGTVNIGGAAGAYGLLNDAATEFTQQYQGVTINVNTLGEPAGYRQLCNGEIDITAIYSGINDELAENCAAADIDLVEIEVGMQATVLVANESTEYLACMATEEIVDTWGAPTTNTITTWDQVNESYPATEFILFAGNTNNATPNLMMQQASGRSIPLRTDTETSTDPLFRAAATANVEGALTYMSWAQYQDVLDTEQDRIQLVAVDGGDGCVTPTEETIDSGEYPLARGNYLIINTEALQRIEVQSYLWFLFQDRRFSAFQRSGFDLLNLKDLFDIRDTLQTALNEANNAAQAATEAEQSATEDATEIEGTAGTE